MIELINKASVEYAKSLVDLQLAEVKKWQGTDRKDLLEAALAWADARGAVTTGDLVELTGVSRGTAQRVLTDLEGTQLRRLGAGRSTRYVRSATTRR